MQEKCTATRRPATISCRPHIRRLSQGTYEIGSRSTPGASYTVTLTGLMSYSCTCPAYAHGRNCWHHAAARQASAFFSKWYRQAVPQVVASPVAPLVAETPVATPAPAPIPLHQTVAYQRLAECFA